MAMSITRAVVLLTLVALLGWLGGPVWACAGVGAGYAFHAVLTVAVTAKFTTLPARAYFANVLRPLLACVPMFLAVAAVRATLLQHGVPGALSLTVQVLCGGLVYIATALVLAGANVGELLRIIRPAHS
jgi:PST family polysaccharide transporter